MPSQMTLIPRKAELFKPSTSYYRNLCVSVLAFCCVPITYFAATFFLLPPVNPQGEVVGGSAREHRYDILAPRMLAAGLLSPALGLLLKSEGGLAKAWADAPPADLDSVPASLDWYLDLRRYGSVPHAGWGLGVERLFMALTGVENIRDALPVPRTPGSCRM